MRRALVCVSLTCTAWISENAGVAQAALGSPDRNFAQHLVGGQVPFEDVVRSTRNWCGLFAVYFAANTLLDEQVPFVDVYSLFGEPQLDKEVTLLQVVQVCEKLGLPVAAYDIDGRSLSQGDLPAILVLEEGRKHFVFVPAMTDDRSLVTMSFPTTELLSLGRQTGFSGTVVSLNNGRMVQAKFQRIRHTAITIVVVLALLVLFWAPRSGRFRKMQVEVFRKFTLVICLGLFCCQCGQQGFSDSPKLQFEQSLLDLGAVRKGTRTSILYNYTNTGDSELCIADPNSKCNAM